MTLITRETYPGLWSFCSLVGSTMDQPPSRGYSCNSQESAVALAEKHVLRLSYSQLLIATGVIDDQRDAVVMPDVAEIVLLSALGVG